jgi:hypothetical protein
MGNVLWRRGRTANATLCVFLLGLTIALTSCSNGGGGGGGGSTPPPTASLTATPASIMLGQNITLTWSSTNADQGSIDNNVGAVGLNGSTHLAPTATTTYTYTATGPGGTATASATVTVNQVTSFDGLKQSDGAGVDVDPNGAVGTKQYMEYVNTAFQAYDKVTGQPVWASAKQIETLWPSGSNCNPPTANPVIQLDVQIIFDRLASRWVVGAKTSDPNLGYYLCLAVSNTDDLSSPSLSWTSISSNKLDPILGSNGTHTYFPDWPKFSTWTDASGQQSAYYATLDLLDKDNGSAEVGVVVCALDRTGILNNPGNIKPEVCVNVSDPSLQSNGIFLGHSLIPADIDGTTLPPAGRDQFMVSIKNPLNDGVTLTSSTLNLWQFHVDWTAGTLTPTLSPVAVDTYTPGCYLFDPNNIAITNCVQEPPDSSSPQQPQLVDSVGDRLMPRFAYRNFGSHESYLVSHTIQTGNNSQNPEQTGVRWYEFRINGSGTPVLNQSGTINPDDVYFRFLPSIAQDKNGNVAVGYSLSNRFPGTGNPGIYFSYWNLPNATAPTEIKIIDGPGEEVSPGNGVGQWGTYASMTVDPLDNCTFWYVNEYFAADDTWVTRIANFQVPGCQ